MTLTLLAILNLLLQAADIVTTILFRRAGIAEANPLLVWLDETITPWNNTGKWLWVVLAKLVGLGVIGAFWYYESKAGLRITAVLFICVVAWNLKQLDKRSGK